MGGKWKGSLTVEASIIIPFVLFIIMALFYLMFFLRDRAVMASAAMRAGERTLWQAEGGDGRSLAMEKGSLPVYMMEVSDFSAESEGTLTALLDLAGSRLTAAITVSGRMTVGIPGSAVFTGNNLKAESQVRALRVQYREDRLKTVFIEKLQK